MMPLQKYYKEGKKVVRFLLILYSDTCTKRGAARTDAPAKSFAFCRNTTTFRTVSPHIKKDTLQISCLHSALALSPMV
jgi:hypothetical protein